MRKWFNPFVQFEHISIVEGNHMPVSSQNDHQFFMDKCWMTISCTRFFPKKLTFLLIVYHLWQIHITLLIARLLSHVIKTENKSLWGGWMRSDILRLIITTLNITEKFLFSVDELSVFLFLNYRHLFLEISNSWDVLSSLLLFFHKLHIGLMHFLMTVRLFDWMQSNLKTSKISISSQFLFSSLLIAYTRRFKLFLNSWRWIVQLIGVWMYSNPSLLGYHPNINII